MEDFDNMGLTYIQLAFSFHLMWVFYKLTNFKRKKKKLPNDCFSKKEPPNDW